MNVFDEAKKRPVVSSITLASVVGGLILLPKVMPSLELIVRITKAPDMAEAAHEEAKGARAWIDTYIQQQKQQQALEAQRYDLERKFNEKLLELQQQQMQQLPNQVAPQMRNLPNPAPPLPLRWWQDDQGAWWVCDPNQADCEQNDSWTLN